jgi:Ferritin-like domain
MNHELNINTVDVDGAIREAAEEATNGHTRADFLKKAGLAGGAAMGGGAVLSALAPGSALAWGGDGGAHGRPPRAFGRGDIGILNYALTLEYLEAAFYNQATAAGAVTDPQTKVFLETVTQDENAHVKFLKEALGGAAVSEPSFDFQGIPENQEKFQQTAFVLENTGVHAYLGQVANIRNPAYLTAAGSIALVEGRHASVIGLIIDESTAGIVPNGPFDTPYTAAEVLKDVGATGFVTGGLATEKPHHHH